MNQSNGLLLWIVNACDTEMLTGNDLATIKVLLDNFTHSLKHYSVKLDLPFSEELSTILKDLQHSSNYIQGVAEMPLDQLVSLHPAHIEEAAKLFATEQHGTTPCQMEQSFAGFRPTQHIENLVADTEQKVNENIKPFIGVTSTDIIHKSDFDHDITKPKFGEVEHFVETLENVQQTGDEVYNTVDEMKFLFRMNDPVTTVSGHYRIDAYKLPGAFYVKNVDSYKLQPRTTVSHTCPTLTYIGYDPEVNELITIINDDALRVTASDFVTMIQDELPTYNGHAISRIVRELNNCHGTNEPVFAKVDISTYEFAEGYIIVVLHHSCDNNYTSFITTTKTFQKYFS